MERSFALASELDIAVTAPRSSGDVMLGITSNARRRKKARPTFGLLMAKNMWALEKIPLGGRSHARMTLPVVEMWAESSTGVEERLSSS
jgi:hypothetical protein